MLFGTAAHFSVHAHLQFGLAAFSEADVVFFEGKPFLGELVEEGSGEEGRGVNCYEFCVPPACASMSEQRARLSQL
jgi:hypothetical protein